MISLKTFSLIECCIFIAAFNSRSCFVSAIFVNILPNEIEFSETIEGEVSKEQFSYYLVNRREDMVLNLSSITGDCDLYVRQALKFGENPLNPNTETDSYDLQSTTCGEDLIFIDNDFIRPFSIGIYAHPSHHLCLFRLMIVGLKTQQIESEKLSTYEEMENFIIYSSKQTKKFVRNSREQYELDYGPDYQTKDLDFLDILFDIVLQSLGFLLEVIV
ncbi:hypothetical protein RDWZM_007701 [Blomia tropicalis]|uniref:Uncharacterized protein n=1 Tax=Blomia tropicalis TaxID=40697 RepID=A0A9Q0M093_BLOTA|nr:hypothetical protein RDWZM_007701 [Blomia tropicalis]